MIDESRPDDLRELTLSITGDALDRLRAGANAGTLAVALLDAAVLVAQGLRGEAIAEQFLAEALTRRRMRKRTSVDRATEIN